MLFLTTFLGFIPIWAFALRADSGLLIFITWKPFMSTTASATWKLNNSDFLTSIYHYTILLVATNSIYFSANSVNPLKVYTNSIY